MRSVEDKKERPVRKLWGSALAYKLVIGGLTLGLLIGIGIMLHPFADRLLFAVKSSRQADLYERRIMGPETVLPNGLTAAEEYERALAYNSRHTANVLADPYSEHSGGGNGETQSEYDALLDPMGNGMMGVLSIPKIHQRLCIYHGTGESTLLRGIGHLEGSSLPVGGEGSHSVLTGHRGLASATLLTDLDQMEEGDRFYIHILGQDLAYEVDQIVTVLPHEISELDIVPGEDYVTLVTCTPYAVNSHRLFVRGHRTEYLDDDAAAVARGKSPWTLPVRIVLIGLLIAAVSLVGILIVKLRKQRGEGKRS